MNQDKDTPKTQHHKLVLVEFDPAQPDVDSPKDFDGYGYLQNEFENNGIRAQIQEIAGMSAGELLALVRWKREQLALVAACGGDTWAEHPDFDRETWRQEVFDANVNSGYWDWVASQLEQRDGESEGIAKSPEPRIPAVVATDDGVHRAEFDAVPWFVTAPDGDIWELWSIGWAGDYQADDVARFFSSRIPAVGDLFKYVGPQQKSFECSIDASAAMAYVAAHRPNIHLNHHIPRVLVDLRSDDGRYQADVDVTGWLEKATDADVQTLLDDGSGARELLDSAVLFHRNWSVATRRLFEAEDLAGRHLREDAGFSCDIRADDLCEWIARRRPHLNEEPSESPAP